MLPARRKEEFSLAYIHAVASVAGFALENVRVDHDSVDCWISSRGKHGRIRSPIIALQIKCTGQDVVREAHLAFPLPIKNYDDLRCEDTHLTRYLVVVKVPAQEAEWLTHSEEQLVLRHCGYWVSLKGAASTENQETVTIQVPRGQLLNPEGLRRLMDRVGEEVAE